MEYELANRKIDRETASILLRGVSVSTLVRAGFGSMAALIVTSWIVCISEDECPIFLPTISNTWVFPPMNYVSRWAVGNLAILFAVFQVCLYFANVNAECASKRARSLNYEFLCGMSVFAIFCFSWVGAICDSASEPSCRGNNTIHSTLAVIFFVLYDLYMAALHWRGPFAASRLRSFALAGSILCKLRWLLPLLESLGAISCCHDDTWLAIIEWADVACIIVWTTSYATDSDAAGPFVSSLTWGGITTADATSSTRTVADASEDFKVLWALSCRSMMKIVALMYVGVLGGCLIAAAFNGVLPHSPNRVPYISDLFVYPPGNWFSRWGIIEATHWLSWVQCFVSYACVASTAASASVSSSSSSSSSSALCSARARCLLSLVAIFGLSVVGVCNEDENIEVHCFGAYLWFGGYDLYMLLTLFEPLDSSEKKAARRRRRTTATVLCCIVLALQAFRWGPSSAIPGLGDLPAGGVNIAPILEWSNALFMMAFALNDVYGRPVTATCAGALLAVPSQSTVANGSSRAVSVSELETALL